MKFIKKIAINTLGLMLIATLLPGFEISSWGVAIVASLVLAVLNMLVKPILFVLTLPVNFLTFGLFSFVINAMLLSLTSNLVGDGFVFSSFWITIVVSILMAIYQRFVENIIESSNKE